MEENLCILQNNIMGENCSMLEDNLFSSCQRDFFRSPIKFVTICASRIEFSTLYYNVLQIFSVSVTPNLKLEIFL